MIIKDCKELCDFYQTLFNAVSDFSFRVNDNGSILFNNDNKRIHPYLGNYTLFSNEFSKRINLIFNNLNSKYCSNETNDHKAYVIPLVQCGFLNVNFDKEFTDTIFNKAAQISRIYLATGYFNLTNSYMNSIVNNNNAEYKVLTAAPIANGFFGSRGFSKYIPDIYLYLEKRFQDLIIRNQQHNRVEISEYNRKDWSNYFVNY